MYGIVILCDPFLILVAESVILLKLYIYLIIFARVLYFNLARLK